ncbi:MAG: DNA polymerase I [Christensenellales bacterium]
MPRITIIDGHSLMFRAFYALPPMNAPDGMPTNAIYGFLSMLNRLQNEYESEYLAVAFDQKGPTFRHLDFDAYKAGRKETPQELEVQFGLLKELLSAMGIPSYECEGYEADDILGTFAVLGEEQGHDVLLVTGDRDALQLVSEHTHVLMTKKGISESIECDENWIKETYNLTPAQIIDLKGLMGDASDGIPGIPGVGEKTALKLLYEYGTLEAVLEHATEIKGKLGERIRAHAEIAQLSKQLATIDTKVPIQIELEHARTFAPDAETIRPIFEKLQLKSLYRKFTGTDLGALRGHEQKSIPRETERIKLKSSEEVADVLRENTGDIAVCADEDGVVFAFDGDVEYVLGVMTSLLDEHAWELPQAVQAIAPALSRRSVIAYDAKKLLHFMAGFGIAIEDIGCDVLIASYLAHGGTAKPLQKLCAQYDVAESKAAALFPLKERLLEKLEEQEQQALFASMEMPLVRVLYDMEQTGFLVDAQTLRELSQQYAIRLAETAQRIYALCGREFNILSPKQLGEVLFEELSLPSHKKTKTGYSTDIEVLEKLYDSHPVVPLIIEYRQTAKLKSTYMDGLSQLVGPDGRIHTTFQQAVTATGRISSTEPNLQNIPVRTEEGRELRKLFHAPEGSLIIDADYSQIELRLLAHIADDPILIRAFRDGEDIHTRTAAEVFGVPLDLVSLQMRSAAKAVNFGIVYGISDFGLARNLRISRKDASEYIRRYMERYTGVREYMHRIVEQAKKQGYVSTMFNRRRELPELYSKNYNTRQFGERVALNMPIQGTAADIIKIAMIRVHEELNKRKLKARLILQVHDELLLQAPREEREEVCALLGDCMQQVVDLSVPLVAEVHSGVNWYEAK